MTREFRHRRTFLNDTERRTLDVLVRRAAPALGPGDAGLLLHLFARMLGDQQHLQSTVGSLRRECTRLRAAAEPPAPEDPPMPCIRVVS